MYRQAIAFALRRGRPHSEVRLEAEESLNGQAHDFAPHVLVRSDSGPEVPVGQLGSVVCLVEVLYTDDMGVRVSVAGGRSYTIEDASMEDLLSVVDEAEGLISG
jgi:hypothetical protein